MPRTTAQLNCMYWQMYRKVGITSIDGFPIFIQFLLCNTECSTAASIFVRSMISLLIFQHNKYRGSLNLPYNIKNSIYLMVQLVTYPMKYTYYVYTYVTWSRERDQNLIKVTRIILFEFWIIRISILFTLWRKLES